MSVPIPLRRDFRAARLRGLAKKTKDGPQARRLLTLAAIYDGASDTLQDFSDTAALISNLDLVISVDTSVAHLAGALAKPVWVLLPYVCDWRWLLDREDSPWYPTARLFRQDDTRAWDNVIARVHCALHDFVRLIRALT
jgi:Glycosyltransferase family 9 (heptosyltransferase)